MEINELRSVVTVVLFVAFVGIVVWTYSRQRRDAFDAAADLPLADDGSGPDACAQRSNGAKQ